MGRKGKQNNEQPTPEKGENTYARLRIIGGEGAGELRKPHLEYPRI